jgi:hypothetical protein
VDGGAVRERGGAVSRRRPRWRALLPAFLLLAVVALSSDDLAERFGMEEPPVGLGSLLGDDEGSPDSYAFMSVQDDGVTPVTYSSCAPIHFEVNDRTMPPAAAGVLDEALVEVAALTGLELVLDGTTARVPDGDPRMLREYQPVLIAWTDMAEDHDLTENVLGTGGSGSIRVGVNGSTNMYVTGAVHLNGPALASYDRDKIRAVLVHELGHVLGLDHVTDATQLMYGDGSRVLSPGAGDRSGFRRLGQGPCVEAW